jgi:hypothetical protein
MSTPEMSTPEMSHSVAIYAKVARFRDTFYKTYLQKIIECIMHAGDKFNLAQFTDLPSDKFEFLTKIITHMNLKAIAKRFLPPIRVSHSPRGGQRIKSNRLRLSKLKAPTTHKTHAAQSRVRQYTQHAGNNIQKTKKQKNKKKQK